MPHTSPSLKGWILLAAPPGAVRRAERRRLRRAGLHVAVAGDATRAAEAALEREYLLVALDDRMAAANGGELRQLLQACGYGDAIAPMVARASTRRLRRLAGRRLAQRVADEALLHADPDFAALVAGYAADLRAKLTALDAALNAADADTALGLVHDIKGTARPYGHAALSAVAGTTQNAFVERRLGDAWAGCRELIRRAAAQLFAPA